MIPAMFFSLKMEEFFVLSCELQNFFFYFCEKYHWNSDRDCTESTEYFG